MRALAIFHKAVPIHGAGAEWMAHAIFTDWIDRGHEVTVTVPDLPEPYTYEGVVTIAAPRGPGELAGLAGDADVVVTHLDNTGAAGQAARDARRPIVHLLHNDQQLQFHKVKPDPSVLIVANSRWLRAVIPRPYATVIARPHVPVARYRISTPDNRDRVTLVNLTRSKGSRVFYDLAAAEPRRPFLGVRGAYGVQDDGPNRRGRNVEIIDNTQTITDDVYARTRVLLMPSGYESWGRCAVEAACSGIPTIAAPTPGLREALGPAGIFVPITDSRGWHRALVALDDDTAYRDASRAASARAVDLEVTTRRDLDILERRVRTLIREGRRHADV